MLGFFDLFGADWGRLVELLLLHQFNRVDSGCFIPVTAIIILRPLEKDQIMDVHGGLLEGQLVVPSLMPFDPLSLLDLGSRCSREA